MAEKDYAPHLGYLFEIYFKKAEMAWVMRKMKRYSFWFFILVYTLFLEPRPEDGFQASLVDGQITQSFSLQNDTFTKGDVGKIFQLSNDRGSGTVVEVSEIVLHGTTLSAAIVEVKEPFFKPKAVQNTIVIEPNGDGSVTIGSVGECILNFWCQGDSWTLIWRCQTKDRS